MSSWNDDRLDKRDEEVKEGFARLEGQIKDGFAATDKRFVRLEGQIAETDKRVVRLEGEVKSGFVEADKRFGKLEGQIKGDRQETNKRFTELRSEMHQGFAELRSEMHQGFAEMQSAYGALNRTLLVGAGGIIAALIGVAGALAA